MAARVKMNSFEAGKPENCLNMSPENAERQVSNSKKSTSPAGKSGSSKGASGGSSPTKRDPSSSSRTSPTKPVTALAKKTSKATMNSRCPEDLYGELMDVKKALSSVNDENVILKTKLRRAEEEAGKRNENDKVSTNLLINNMKRKIQRLEESLKEKENSMKKLQNEAKAAKQEAKVALDANKQDAAAAKRSSATLKENAKPAAAKVSQAVGRSAGSARVGSSSVRGPSQSISEEVSSLKEKLRRALAIHSKDVDDNYGGMSAEELVAEIVKLKEEISSLKSVHSKLGVGDGSDVPAWRVREAEMAEEIERLKGEIQHVREDILLYFESSETKEAELKNLRVELDSSRKELLEGVKSGRARLVGSTVKQTAAAAAVTAMEPRGRVASTTRSVETPASRTVAHGAAGPTHAKAKLDMTVKKVSSTVTNSDVSKRAAPAPKAKPPVALTVKMPITTTKPKPIKPKECPVPMANGHSPVAVAPDAPKVPTPRSSLKNQKEVEDFKKNVAARKIQKEWKRHRENAAENENADESQMMMMTEEDAARVTERGWQGSQKKGAEEDIDEAVTTIQSAARGHIERSEQLEDKFAAGESISSVSRGGDSIDDFVAAEFKDLNNTSSQLNYDNIAGVPEYQFEVNPAASDVAENFATGSDHFATSDDNGDVYGRQCSFPSVRSFGDGATVVQEFGDGATVVTTGFEGRHHNVSVTSSNQYDAGFDYDVTDYRGSHEVGANSSSNNNNNMMDFIGDSGATNIMDFQDGVSVSVDRSHGIFGYDGATHVHGVTDVGNIIDFDDVTTTTTVHAKAADGSKKSFEDFVGGSEGIGGGQQHIIAAGNPFGLSSDFDYDGSSSSFSKVAVKGAEDGAAVGVKDLVDGAATIQSVVDAHHHHYQEETITTTRSWNLNGDEFQ